MGSWVFDGEAVAFVEALGGAALEDVQADGDGVGVGLFQQGSQDGRAEAAALEVRGEVEVLQPAAVLGRADGDAACEGAVGHDDRRVLRGEGIPQPLPDPVLVVAAQPLQVRAHHRRPQLRDRLDIGRLGGTQRPVHTTAPSRRCRTSPVRALVSTAGSISRPARG